MLIDCSLKGGAQVKLCTNGQRKIAFKIEFFNCNIRIYGLYVTSKIRGS